MILRVPKITLKTFTPNLLFFPSRKLAWFHELCFFFFFLNWLKTKKITFFIILIWKLEKKKRNSIYLKIENRIKIGVEKSRDGHGRSEPGGDSDKW